MRARALIVSILVSGALAAEEAEVPKGAKELFFAGSSVVNSGPGPGEAPRPDPGVQPRERPRPGPKPPAGRAAPAREPRSPLGLRYWIELVDRDDAPGRRVPDSRVFSSGEQIRLHLDSNAPGYVLLVQLGASGSSSVLFPDQDKGAVDDRLVPGTELVLPNPTGWFRFDDTPGTERLLVLFGRSREELQELPVRPQMAAAETRALLDAVSAMRGSKDLVLETEPSAAETATYAVNRIGKPVALEVSLQHR